MRAEMLSALRTAEADVRILSSRSHEHASATDQAAKEQVARLSPP